MSGFNVPSWLLREWLQLLLGLSQLVYSLLCCFCCTPCISLPFWLFSSYFLSMSTNVLGMDQFPAVSDSPLYIIGNRRSNEVMHALHWLCLMPFMLVQTTTEVVDALCCMFEARSLFLCIVLLILSVAVLFFPWEKLFCVHFCKTSNVVLWCCLWFGIHVCSLAGVEFQYFAEVVWFEIFFCLSCMLVGYAPMLAMASEFHANWVCVCSSSMECSCCVDLSSVFAGESARAWSEADLFASRLPWCSGDAAQLPQASTCLCTTQSRCRWQPLP